LEQAPAVALWFAEKLGKAGFGLERVDRFFARWSNASEPAVTASALATARFRVALRLRRLLKEGKGSISIRADSEEEAAAFAAAVLMRHPRLAARVAVVTAPSGWQWVKQNPDLRFVLCASSELAKEAPAREGLVVLVPHARGDLSPSATAEAPASEGAKGPELLLPRPDEVSFAKALQKLGIEEQRAGVLSGRCGRSWSAFRRLHALDPASRTPPWLERPEARALGTLALFGAFSDCESDRKLVEEVAGRPWEEIERDLRTLADRADPPVLEIDGVWKAKAIAELFLVAGPRITRGELDRFFAVAQRVLSGCDQSAVVSRFLGDSLVRLAVLGPGCLKAEPGIEARVRKLVLDLLAEADADRWRSLAPRLPDLAEAAPDEFLGAVDRNVRHAREAGSGLRSALAVLGWSPDHLGWVVDIVCRIRLQYPSETRQLRLDELLLDFFRPAFPQTTASLDQRLEALERIAERDRALAFTLCTAMVPPRLPWREWFIVGPQPNWRDAWLRREKVAPRDYARALAWAADRAIALAKGHPDRLATLVERLEGLRAAGREKALFDALVCFVRTNPADDERVRFRDLLQKQIDLDERRWKKPFRQRPSALSLARLWRAFAPRDPVLRYARLFDHGYADLPGAFMNFDAGERASRRRRELAVQVVVREAGFEGLFRLAERAKWPGLVGEATVHVGIEPCTLVRAALERGAFARGPKGPVEHSVLVAIKNAPLPVRQSALETLSGHLARIGRPAADIATVLAFFADDAAMRDLIGKQPEDVRRELRLIVPQGPDDIRALLAAGRPVAALNTVFRGTDPAPTALLFEILEKLAELGPEPNAPTDFLPYFVTQAVRRLEDEPSVDRRRLAELELALYLRFKTDIPAFARSLFEWLTSDPAIFVELVQAAFRAEGEPPRALDPAAKLRAERAVNLLVFDVRYYSRLPGQRADGTIDDAALALFVDEVRRRAGEIGRLAVAERSLGRIFGARLAGLFVEASQTEEWLPEPIAALLDRTELRALRESFEGEFAITLFNSEPEVARKVECFPRYRERLLERARRSEVRCPRTAASLKSIATRLWSWVEDGRRELRRAEEGLW
ncbi:MAG: hypothetical protein N2038_10035, partial [Geminicoccaceae bacterium]|nr:hypothetical protein [Geminicoccaceae bacterium]